MKKFIKRLFSALTKERAIKGFSLIELLVVIAIIGVLAAVAIPAYNGYRTRATQATLNNSMHTVGKGFAACNALNQWNECQSLTQINVSCPDCKSPSSATVGANMQWCIHAEKTVGGTPYKVCLESTGGVPTIFPSWEKTHCNRVTGTYNCASDGKAYVVVAGSECSDKGCGNATNPGKTSSAADGVCTSGATGLSVNCKTNDPNERSSNSYNGVCASGKCN